ncbi:MAG: MgtC/SapB family protein [Clostridia bacterium]|nr:MgtC/SapB family protein [Clostridia bacterium]
MLNSTTEFHLIVRLLLAALFGALIGIEREHAKRPAGLRTHVLVCVSACLVMLTAEFISKFGYSPYDITRLGAQVISGIGFLGAGTIIRNGNTVKGLTTAASLWAVACVGLATGIGFYMGATLATVVIFFVLTYFKTFIEGPYTHNTTEAVSIKFAYSEDLLDKIKAIFSENKIIINNIKLKSDKENVTNATLVLTMNEDTNLVPIFENIYNIDGIYEIESKSIEE